jgi:hypothetical protein
VEVGKSTIQVKYTLVRGEKSNEIVSEYFGGLRALIESCGICWFRKSNRNPPHDGRHSENFQDGEFQPGHRRDKT